MERLIVVFSSPGLNWLNVAPSEVQIALLQRCIYSNRFAQLQRC